MKRALALGIFGLMLSSQFALADGGTIIERQPDTDVKASMPEHPPGLEPGPRMKLDAQAHEITRILLSRGVAKCVAEFQKEDLGGLEVTRQGLRPGRTMYRFDAVTLKDGDIATGGIHMAISEVETQGGNGEPVVIYTCEGVSRDGYH